ncbi:MAG: hypothetical protein K6G33_14230 [Ruminococcus sp.]|nr:hypothetical protein [Ruminococcus sp.]MCR5601879.1 hypothetical protein [Ruminococcus sp.]
MRELNKNVNSNENYDVAIEEMLEREEFSCTGNGCAGNACGAYNVEL